MSHAHPTPILSLATDSFSQALSELDPATRALLDLSLRRGMRPEEIGDLLGTDPESVIVARENALEQLASELGMGDVTELDGVRARLAELPGEAWTPPARSDPAAQAEPESEEHQRRELELLTPEAQNERSGPAKRADQPGKTRKSPLPVLLALLAVAAIVAAALLITRGSGDDTASPPNRAPAPAARQPAAKQNKAAPAAPSDGPKVKLASPTGAAGTASATARLTDGGKRLVLTATSLPDPGTGSYQVWLFNSVIDARSIGSARGRDLQVDLKLPARASRYSSVDVSVEPRDGNPNHSGQSVLRVPLSKLSR